MLQFECLTEEEWREGFLWLEQKISQVEQLIKETRAVLVFNVKTQCTYCILPQGLSNLEQTHTQLENDVQEIRSDLIFMMFALLTMPASEEQRTTLEIYHQRMAKFYFPAAPLLPEEIQQAGKNLQPDLTALSYYFQKYRLGLKLNQEGFAQGLRKAAAVGDVDGLIFFLKHCNNIDAADSNPQKKRTALHWAIEKGALVTAKILIQEGAKSCLHDAFKKTAADYARNSDNEDIRALFPSALKHKF